MSAPTAGKRGYLGPVVSGPPTLQHSAVPTALGSPQGLLQQGAALLTRITRSGSGCPLVRGGFGVSAGQSAGAGDETLVPHGIVTDVCRQKHQLGPYKV